MEQPQGMNENGVRRLAKHFVSLSWIDKTPGAGGRAAENDGHGEPFAASGFIVAAKGHWFLVTAGHILRDIDLAMTGGQLLEDWQLDDGWSLDRQFEESIPFNLADARRYYFVNKDAGWDYGFVELHPLICRNLRANRIVPVDIHQWTPQSPTKFEGYALLGIPSERIGALTDSGVTQSIVSLPLEEDDDPPAVLIKPFPRWYGRIKRFGSPATTPIRSLDGMSGGPIFGFKHCDGGLRYWIIAVQTSWSPTEGAVAACPIRVLIEFLEREVEP